MITTPPMVGVPILVWWLVGPSSRICWPKPSLRNWLMATRVPRRETSSANAPLSRMALIRSLSSGRPRPLRHDSVRRSGVRRGPPWTGCLDVPRVVGQQLADHVPVVERVHDPGAPLAGLGALARHDHDVARPGEPERRGDRHPAVALLDDLGTARVGTLQYRGPD